jgi:hypothetical protein
VSRRSVVLFVAITVAAVLTVTPAQARTLGGILSATLFSFNTRATFTDPSWAYDAFTGPDGTAVGVGRALSIGGTWATADGSFALLGNRLRATAAAQNSGLSVDLGAGRADAQLLVDLTFASTGTGRSAGVLLRYGILGFLRVVVTDAVPGGQVELQRVILGATSTLAAGAVGGATLPTALRLRVRAIGPTVTAYLGGSAVPVLAFTLSGFDSIFYTTPTRVGVTTDDATTRLDDFRVVAP